MTSLIHEAIMLGTPCLIMDDIFIKEYKSFNIPIHDIYFSLDIDFLLQKVVHNETIPNNQIKNIQVFNKAVKDQDKNIIKILTLANNHFFSQSQESFKKNITKNKNEQKNFYNFYLEKWGSKPIFNITTKKSLIYYYVFFDNLYLYQKLLKFRLDLNNRKFFSLFAIFKFNLFKLRFNRKLFYATKFLISQFVLKKKYTDRDLINLIKDFSDVFRH